MLKILCPTDFSDHAKIALEYAIHLANEIDAELHFIAAYEVPKKSSSFIALDDTIKKNNEEDMKELIAGISPLITNDILPISHVYRGHPVDIIPAYAEKYNMDLIIMGTQGNNSLRTLLFGSVTKRVASKSTVPVLAIPEIIAHELTSNNILLALDDKILENEDTFKTPRALLKALNLQVDIIHISDDDEDIPFDPFISSYLEGLIDEVVIRKGDDAVHEIKKYAEKNDVGMVMMVRRKKGFFERLLTVGNTSEEIARTNIPLMILPE